jgi:uncharacterized repeat protein (TIGR02543 family)
MPHIKNKLPTFLLLSIALLLCFTETSFAASIFYARSFGGPPENYDGDIKYYDHINEKVTFKISSSTYNGTLFGWAVTDVAVDAPNVTSNDEGGGRVTYDIPLSAETDENATFYLWIDRESDSVYAVAATTSTATYSNRMLMAGDCEEFESKIPVELSDGSATKTVRVFMDGSKEYATGRKYVFNFHITEAPAAPDPAPENVESIGVSGTPRTAYKEGQKFSRASITVTANLSGSGTAPVTGYKATPQHVFEEYKDEVLKEYIQKFYDDKKLSDYEDLLSKGGTLLEEYQAWYGDFDYYFGEYLEEHGLSGLEHAGVNDERLLPGDTYVLISYGNCEPVKVEGLTVNPSPGILAESVEISNGQMMDKWTVKGIGASATYAEKTDRFDAVVRHGETSGRFSFSSASAAAKVYVDGSETPLDPVEEGKYDLEIDLTAGGTDAVFSGVSKTVTVVTEQADEDPSEMAYVFTCYLQRFGDMPAEVTEYLPMASQYTNGTFQSGMFGLNPVRTLRGVDMDYSTGTGMNAAPVSLGNFGGYIVYRYDEPIRDDPNNPWGVDFIVYGNPVHPNDGYAEPGNVLVSTDGKEWFTLAGSAHYEDYAKWGHQITYTNQSGKAAWKDGNGNSGTSFSYPIKDIYPHFDWAAKASLENEMTLEGVYLQGSGPSNSDTRFPDFGYADTGYTRDDSNEAGNPYTGNGGWRSTQDGFDIRWAVDGDGKPADLSGTDIYYVKIQTASFIINGEASKGGTGEKSTEVNGVRLAGARASDVGVTGAPAGISVEGVNVLLYGERDAEYEKDYVYNNVAVTGKFTVAVDAPGANVYINGDRGADRTFEGMPDHGMVRVIVQEGEKRPVIYYLSLKEVPGEDKSTTVTLDADGGEIVYKGENVTTANLYFTPHTPAGEARTFPAAGYNIGYTFIGWFDENGIERPGYTDDMPEALTLTAKWEAEGEPPVATVTFDARGGALPAGAQAEQEYRQGMTFPTPTRAGYAFAGWHYGDAAQTGYNEALKDVPGLTFDARWTLKITTVSFDAGDGLFTSTGNSARTVPYSVESASKSFPTPVREGYAFDGWFDSKGAEHKAYSAALADTPALSLTARWTKDSGNGSNDTDTGTGSTDTGGEYTVDTETDPAKPAVTVPGVTEVAVSAETGAAAATTTEVANGSLSGAIETAVKAAKDAGSAEPVISVQAKAEEAGDVKAAAVKIHAEDLKAVADSGENVSVRIESSAGEITLDSGAVKDLVAKAADAETVEVVIERKDDAAADGTLTEDQKKAVEGDARAVVYDVTLFADDRPLGGFSTAAGGGKLTIGLPYTLRPGEVAAGVQAVYLPADGDREPMDTEYKKGLATFETTHLSVYAVTYVPRSAEDAADTESGGGWGQAGGSGPGGGCGTGITGIAALLILALVIARKRRAA